MLIGGDAASIRVSTTSGVATFTDKFEVEINFGWGDCPAGCISHQTYVVAIEPVLKADGTYEFNTVVTKSEGNGGVIF